MNKDFLKEGKNEVSVVGKLKSNFLKEENGVIRGNVVVESKADDGSIHEVEANVWAKEGWGNYKNLKNVVNMVDSANALDESFVTKLRIIGNYELNEFVTRKGELVSENRIKMAMGYPSNSSKDDRTISLTGVLTKKDDVGEDLYLWMNIVGYQNTIIDTVDGIRVPKDFEDTVNTLYNVGDTIKIDVEYVNTAKVVEDNSDMVAFGTVEDSTVTEVVKELVLKGGYPPLKLEEGAYSKEEVGKILELREQQHNEVKAKISPQSTGGFGSDVGGFGNIEGFNPSSNDIPF